MKIKMEFVNPIFESLNLAVREAYRLEKKRFVKRLKKDVLKFSGTDFVISFADKPSMFSPEFNKTDLELLRFFEKDCFEVACILSYDLQVKLKELAKTIAELPESDTTNRKELFANSARDLIASYVPESAKTIPPAGILRTNLQTAISSAHSAAQYTQFTDPDVKDVYPVLMYKTQEDAKVREEHARLADFAAYSYDPVWKKIYPPNGWNCRCYVTPLTLSEARKLGLNMPKERTTAEVNEIVKEARIDGNFIGNPAEDKTLFGKWKRQQFRDLPQEITNQIKKLSKERE